MPIHSIHSKNANTFDRLTNFCVIHRQRYNPSNKYITEAALLLKQTEAVLSIQNVKAAKNAFNISMSECELAVANIQLRSKLVVMALENCGCSMQTIEKAQCILQHILLNKSADQKTPYNFDSAIENFGLLVHIIAAEVLYNPKQHYLKKEALQTMLDEVQAINLWFTEISNTVITAYIERNNQLYHPQTGLVALAEEVKKYIKLVFGFNSPEYKKVSSFRFIIPCKDEAE